MPKWERDLSFPDDASLPLLAEQLGVSVDELLEARTSAREESPLGKAGELAELVLKAVALAMGVGVAALAVMDEVETRVALCLLGIGVACLALVELSRTGEETARECLDSAGKHGGRRSKTAWIPPAKRGGFGPRG